MYHLAGNSCEPYARPIHAIFSSKAASISLSTHGYVYRMIARQVNFTSLLIPWSRVLHGMLTGSQPIKQLPAFYGTHRFTTAFKSARHLSLSWAREIPYMSPHPTSWRTILILSYYLCLGLPSDFFPSDFPTKPLYKLLLSSICATCPAHLILLDLTTRTIMGEEYRSLSSSWCSFLHFPITSSLLGPNILLRTLFSNTLSLGPPSVWATKFPTLTKHRQNYSCVYLNVYIFG